ncbi:MAG: Zn-dependent protease [Myxococcales bacterium]|nr:Zn-dependent protease [Myxococcales bacterium]
MIDQVELVRALGQREVADWVIIERAQQLASVDGRLHRAEHRKRWLLTVHLDLYNGRGSAHLAIDAVDGTADAIVDQAIALARAAVGPAWTSVPPTAPAKVALLDPSLAAIDPFEAAEGMLRGFKRPAGVTVDARARVLREQVTAIAKTGFRTQWNASIVRIDALVTARERSLEISREARQVADLETERAIAGAAADLELLAAAGAPAAGPCSLVFATDAMLHGGLGVWAAFANQGDAIVERQGLTRYREHAAIVAGADQLDEPLTVTSDGALDFGLLSAPIGDEGDAVRRFLLVERGIAVGLGLSPREAAFRSRDPNGGVRNLVIETGTWSGAPDEAAGPQKRRVVELRRLRSLAIDPYTGDASLEIALGVDRATGKTFSGGTVRLDLIAALARARRTATRISRGSYQGPSAVRVDRAELIV